MVELEATKSEAKLVGIERRDDELDVEFNDSDADESDSAPAMVDDAADAGFMVVPGLADVTAIDEASVKAAAIGVVESASTV